MGGAKRSLLWCLAHRPSAAQIRRDEEEGEKTPQKGRKEEECRELYRPGRGRRVAPAAPGFSASRTESSTTTLSLELMSSFRSNFREAPARFIASALLCSTRKKKNSTLRINSTGRPI